MANDSSLIHDLQLVDFDVEAFLTNDLKVESRRLTPWVDPDKKIADYKRRLEKHRVLRDDYHKRFIEYKIFLKRTKTGEKENKPPTKSFYEFSEKVISEIPRD